MNITPLIINNGLNPEGFSEDAIGYGAWRFRNFFLFGINLVKCLKYRLNRSLIANFVGNDLWFFG